MRAGNDRHVRGEETGKRHILPDVREKEVEKGESKSGGSAIRKDCIERPVRCHKVVCSQVICCKVKAAK